MNAQIKACVGAQGEYTMLIWGLSTADIPIILEPVFTFIETIYSTSVN